MFAKLVPYLCHITNKDEGFEVRTQNNSGICEYYTVHVHVHVHIHVLYTHRHVHTHIII